MTPAEARLRAMEIVGPGVAAGRIALALDAFEELRRALVACGLDARVEWVEGPLPGYVPGTPMYRGTVGGVRVFVRPAGAP